MPKFRKVIYPLLILILILGFVGCDDNDGVTSPDSTLSDLVTIYWDNQTSITLDFYLDWVFAQQVLPGQIGSTSGVSKGSHIVHGCPAGYDPYDGVCTAEQVDLTSDFTYRVTE